MIATIGSSILCMSLPYEAGLNAKHLAWAGKQKQHFFQMSPTVKTAELFHTNTWNDHYFINLPVTQYRLCLELDFNLQVNDTIFYMNCTAYEH